LIVAHDWQRTGLGTLLARELFHLASQCRVDRIMARLMRPQTGAHRIMSRTRSGSGRHVAGSHYHALPTRGPVAGDGVQLRIFGLASAPVGDRALRAGD
jgi:hypothetical protein